MIRLAIACVSLTLLGCCNVAQQKHGPPLGKVAASLHGYFRDGYSWDVSLDLDKEEGTLVVFGPHGEVRSRFSLSQGVAEKIHSLASSALVVNAPPELGYSITEESTIRISVDIQDIQKTVLIRYLPPEQRTATTRALLTLFTAIRRSFDSPMAQDWGWMGD